MANLYDSFFNNADGIKIIRADTWSRTVYWRYTILLNERIDINKFKDESIKLGISIRETYLPLHLHPYFKEHNNLSLPNCEKIGRSAIDIPSSFNLREKDITYVAENLKKIAKKLLISK